MTFSDFIKKDNRRKIRNSFPDFFISFQKELSNLTLNAIEKNNTVKFEFYKNEIFTKELLLQDYLDSILGRNIQQINDRIIEHFENGNQFKENLPLFIIRRHGSYSGDEGSLRRRRGWLVKFDNAWIVYADNFFPRHFFESTYFVDSGSSAEFSSLNQELKMPYASGGGRFEKKHRIFPTLTHLSASSNIYLSHLYDLNQSNYTLSRIEVSASEILGNNSDNKFGYGLIEDWDNGLEFDGYKKYRIVENHLSKNELDFLKAYNVRMLSPFNYFPFPKNRHLKIDSMNGENQILRNHVKNYMERKFTDSFNRFRIVARVKY